MSDRFEPSRIAAIVVGIERYGFRGPGRVLRGPGLHALEFVEVARSAGIEPARIHLFLSLNDTEALSSKLAALHHELPWRNAGLDLEDFLAHRLESLDCDLLYFYWCGHGVMTGPDRRLLYEDANDDLYHNLSVSDLLQYLHSDKCAQNTQIGFLDACAVRAGLDARRLAAQTVLWEDNELIQWTDRSQFFYYAAAPWRTAQSDGDIAYFSKAVLDVLREDPARLLAPDPEEWDRRIKARFNELWPREAREFGPVSFFDVANGDIRKGTLVPGSRSAARRAAGAGNLRRGLLDEVQNERIQPRLRQGLREAIRIDLGLTQLPGAVAARLREYTRLESGAAVENPIGGPVEEIFENAGAQMLILGDPGSGKTTLLLELAEYLVQQAAQDEMAPIPIVLSLPRWAVRTGPGLRERTIAEWIENDLVDEYQVSQKDAARLVAEDRVLPLLDGLDEMAADRRAACIYRIHEYQRGRNLGRLAVCCRAAEYAVLPKLDLGIAVRLEKLSRDDVEREIARPGLERVRQAMENDQELWEFVDTPLWLHVLYGAAQAPPADSSVDKSPRDRLYSRYVDYALARKGVLPGRRQSEPPVILGRLIWLAGNMKQRNQVEFAVKNLDTFWVSRTGAGRLSLNVVHAAVAGLVAGAVGGLRIGAAIALGSLLTGGTLYFGYAAAFWRIRPNAALSYALNVLASAAFYGLAGLIAPGPVLGVFAALIVAITIPVEFLFLWLRHRKLTFDLKSYPSGYIQLVHLASLAFAFVLLANPLGSWLVPPYMAKLAAPLIFAWAASAFLNLIVHYPIRLALWLRGRAPLRYERFLDEAVERLFMIRRGGEYEFIHITFRDYLAGRMEK